MLVLNLTSDETGSDEPIRDEVPTITHSVVFKCIGSHKLLSLANKKINSSSEIAA